jgi:Leucine-rich repeat (LRR) protein
VPAALGGLTALKSLYLDGNKLTSVPVEIAGLIALKRCASTAII